MKVGVAKEIAPGERRVALVPESIDKLRAAGISVFVERGAGVEAAFPDSAYVEAGARIVTTPALYSNCDVILRINRPTPAEAKHAPKPAIVPPATQVERAQPEARPVPLRRNARPASAMRTAGSSGTGRLGGRSRVAIPARLLARPQAHVPVT